MYGDAKRRVDVTQHFGVCDCAADDCVGHEVFEKRG
jgi:hypothetical protein